MKDLQQEEQVSAVKPSVKPSTGNKHTFQKTTGTGNQQASGK